MQRAFYHAYLKSTVDSLSDLLIHVALNAFFINTSMRVENRSYMQVILIRMDCDPVVEGLDIVDLHSLIFFGRNRLASAAKLLFRK